MKKTPVSPAARFLAAVALRLAALTDARAEDTARPLASPRKRIAVARLDVDRGLAGPFEGQDVGGNLSAQLATETPLLLLPQFLARSRSR